MRRLHRLGSGGSRVDRFTSFISDTDDSLSNHCARNDRRRMNKKLNDFAAA